MEFDFAFDADAIDVDGQIFYDREYKSDIFRKYFYSFVGNGVFAETGNALLVLSKTPEVMEVVVKSGQAWAEGAFYINDDDLTLTIEPSHNTLNRIDAVVIRCDYTERHMYATVVTGTPATTPSHYIPVRNANMFELKLAEVYVPFASLNVKQSNITDYRAVSAVCGWVTGYLQSIDADSFFEAYQLAYTQFMQELNTEADNLIQDTSDEFNTFLTGAKAEFEGFDKFFRDWFDSIKEDTNLLVPFNFDNIAAMPGCSYNYLDGEKGTDFDTPIFEYIRKTDTQRLVAKRITRFPTETTMTTQTIRYAKDGLTEVDNTLLTTNIENGDTEITGTTTDIFVPINNNEPETGGDTV